MIPPTSSPRRHKPISAHRIINTALQEQKAPVAVQPLQTLRRDGGAVLGGKKREQMVNYNRRVICMHTLCSAAIYLHLNWPIKLANKLCFHAIKKKNHLINSQSFLVQWRRQKIYFGFPCTELDGPILSRKIEEKTNEGRNIVRQKHCYLQQIFLKSNDKLTVRATVFANKDG